MKVENFIKTLIEEFPQIDDSNIKAADNLFDTFGWSSLNILLIRAKIIDEYGVDLSDDKIKSCTTIQDLHNEIKKHVL
ncbi:MAG: acyl carrier protein [Flavobacteriales bacterium]|nr:acyl carrier protein [Flavobacteriales bacterium]